jgi:DNA segregation ATPase FtsK/SpoIIIE-like protein
LVDAYRDEIPGDEINFTDTTDRNVLFEGGIDDDLGDDDELYETAKEEVIKAGKASTSYIQRKLRVGYARAARLVDMLEERGVIGPGDGAKPREVISNGNEVSQELEEEADKILAKGKVDENGFEEPENPKEF